MRMSKARVEFEQRRVAFKQQWVALELQRQESIRLAHKYRVPNVFVFLHWLIRTGIYKYVI